eukprot:Clim_evm19s4 gene=Clim_evmTU19s4
MASHKDEVETKVANYYDSQDASIFYDKIWGGESVHLGIHPSWKLDKLSSVEEIKIASDAADEIMAQQILSIALRTPPTAEHPCRIIDLGSALGSLARMLASGSPHIHVTCYDISKEENEKCRKRNREQGLDSQIEVYDRSFLDVPADLPNDKKYDFVISQDAMLHCTDHIGLIQRMAGIVKPSGNLIFTDIMQSSRVKGDELKDVYARLHLDRMASTDMYVYEFAKYGVELMSYQERTDHLVAHYASTRHLLVTTGRELGVSQAYIDSVGTSLQSWVDNGRKGLVQWGYFHFRAPLA